MAAPTVTTGEYYFLRSASENEKTAAGGAVTSHGCEVVEINGTQFMAWPYADPKCYIRISALGFSLQGESVWKGPVSLANIQGWEADPQTFTETMIDALAELTLPDLDSGGGGGGIGGSTGGTNRAVLIADGTGGSTLQAGNAFLSGGGALTLGGSLKLSPGESVRVNNIQVISDQQSAIADPSPISYTPSSYGMDSGDIYAHLLELRTQLVAALDALRAHGAIAT